MHSMFAIDTPPGCSCHHHSFTEATGTEEAFQRALETGSLLARTGLDLITDDKLYTAVRKEWEDSKHTFEGRLE